MEAQLLNTEKQILKVKASKGLMWFGIISITMLFAGLTSAYIVRQGEGKWVQFALPELFKISTILIVLSSVTMQWAVRAIKRNNKKTLKVAISLTAALGIGFVLFQYLSWSQLVSQGIYLVGQVKDIHTQFQYIPAGKETATEVGTTGNVAASFLYVITGLHVAHLLGGMIAIFVVLSHALFGKYSETNYKGVSICAIYWHFLDGLWVYLYLFLLYIR